MCVPGLACWPERNTCIKKICTKSWVFRCIQVHTPSAATACEHLLFVQLRLPLPPFSPAAAMLCPTLGSSSRAGAEAAAAAAPAPPVAPAGPAPVFSAVAASRPRPLRPPPLHPRAAAAQKVRWAWGARSRPRSGGAPPPPLHPRAAAPAAPKHKVRPAHSKLSRFLHLLLL